ncbi:class I SAM-dependent methyltransferase [Streptomyces sp. NPDC004732]|uniref:class I SAM-dependent methyltransferase n=1 Tax=Streptomyces sp. NPDC004732 TaxID=3154290 RepID=UPI0033A9FBAE
MEAVQEYYARSAEDLAERYESVRFETVHREVLPFLPTAPARVADVGAGTGRDAAAFAARGFDVVAVEPVPELRAWAQRLHTAAEVTWLDDALPALPRLAGPFDLILLSAVWTHLKEDERDPAMRRLYDLTAPGGIVALSLRHGPPPADRRMFDVPVGQTVLLAEHCGFTLLHVSGGGPDRLGRSDVTWSQLILHKEQAG